MSESEWNNENMKMKIIILMKNNNEKYYQQCNGNNQ
jgi:hypothetical protein